MELRRINAEIEAEMVKGETILREIRSWVAVLGVDAGIKDLVKIRETLTSTGNIGGLEIPLFEKVVFEDTPYDLFEKPLWMDTAVEAIRKLLYVDEKLKILKTQAQLVTEEWRVTTQRVNLFEKVKIPESRENIKIIQVFLGDQQAAAVVRGKIAKNKLVRA